MDVNSRVEEGNTNSANKAVQYCLLVHSHRQRVNQCRVFCVVFVYAFGITIITSLIGRAFDIDKSILTVFYAIVGAEALGVIISTILLAVFRM